ncbi:hypothetical protein BO86DRAFT_410877 [Aspergillus japonicus CBS 114.51]|uniref:Aminoglycoside phosphotransferase domain-containing protein n=1 Tax=Aspergillus japonicus CBS 114.51 TaxID=1448312 RepID=A0A8T8WXD5_ASPJA|nr:hypothetical protein BO86DRAFT_410877 [Aspergillus japonicus CBS 114.51]RAH80324.1 hypothetical protein BO86DRAFT_410877 [Aspergillus japonicus CBS 114.51]
MTTQPAVLPLLRGSITLDEALDQEEDMLLELSFPTSRVKFFVSLYSRRHDTATLVAEHSLLSRCDQCFVGEVKEWIHGSFNVCIPVRVEGRAKGLPRRVMIRFPLPYKVGEALNPDNVDEKLRCEPLPLSEYVSSSLMSRFLGYGVLGSPVYTRTHASHDENLLLVMDSLDDPEVQMLSETWNELLHDGAKTTNLYRDMSRIMLPLSQLPLLRIGSWTIDTNGVLQLTNRPLTLRLHQLDNAGIPTNMDRSLNYASADSYYHDILSCHDSRLRHQPNSMYDEDDGRAQMANLTMMRALLPQFTDRDLSHGPFFYRLTDLHQSNIFVDKDWNIKYLIDLEWACSLPAEIMRPPYWLTGRPVDDILGEHLDTFSEAHGRFMDIFQAEEKRYLPLFDDSAYRTSIMRRGWEVGNFWYFHALDSPKGLFNVFRDHIQPRFAASQSADLTDSRIVSEYWSVDTMDVIEERLKAKETYENELRRRFQDTCDSA